jgi:hypothetical protein
VASFVLYAMTASRGAQWQDSGYHILRVVSGELLHPLGLALSHPLHHWLGRIVVSLNVLEPCLAVTLISALAGAAAVASIYGCVLTLTRSAPSALLAAGSLGVAHTFWQMATVSETYTLAAALLAAECWSIAGYAVSRRRGYLCAALLLNGLAVSNHMLASLTTPVLAGVVVAALWHKEVRIKDAAIALGLWLLGSAPYTGLIISEMLHTGDCLGTLHSALFGRAFAGEVLNTALSARTALVGGCFVLLSFPNLLLPAAVVGVFRAGRVGVPKLARCAFLSGLVIHVIFVARYDIVDQHMFYVPAYVLLSVFGGIGFAALTRRKSARMCRAVLAVATAGIVATPVVYAVVPTVAKRFNVLRSVMHNRPYRDDYTYVFAPWSVVERSAERMSRQAVELAGPRGLILIEDPMSKYAVQYRALRDGLDDLAILHRFTPEIIADAVRAGRAVVLVPLDVDAPRNVPPIGSWRRVGDLYVLAARPETL